MFLKFFLCIHPSQHEQCQFFSRIQLGWIKSFSSPTSKFTKNENSISPTISLIAGGRTDGFMPFSRSWVWSEIQTALYKTWTPVTTLISYNNNHNAKSTSYNHLFEFRGFFSPKLIAIPVSNPVYPTYVILHDIF